MKYKGEVVEAIFLERPNRFIAMVKIKNETEKVHVKNTGRCKELLIPGVKVYLEKATTENRKTKYSLIAVNKGDLLINMDSQVPNEVVYDAVLNGLIKEIPKVTLLKREKTYQNSRFDMYYESKESKGFIEVKGVTLENEGLCKFPDAPTERGRKHVNELINAQREGYENFIIFLAQFNGAKELKPNKITDPKFAESLIKASNENVKILCYDCIVTKNTIRVNKKIKVILNDD